MPLAPAFRAVRGLLAGIVSPLAALGLLAPSGALAQQPFDIALRDGLLSIRANGASVTELAAALAAETGIDFVVTGDAGATITTEIVDEPFVKAVAKLSPNHLLMREDKNPDSAVTEVVLILDESGGGGGGGDGFLPSGAPADEIYGDEQAFSSEPLPIEEMPMNEVPFDETVQPVGADGGFGDAQDGIDPENVDQSGYQDREQVPQQ